MAPKTKEPQSAGELEDVSCTRTKRARRVSFAETTIHVFKRDEESESPGISRATTSVRGSPDKEETSGFRGENSMDSSPEEDDEEDGPPLRFFRDIDSFSPGSGVGSLTSNDDDNCFGPVTTSFIDSSLLSESGMSDDNSHDITLDSTSFSLHFMNKASPGDHSANSMGSLRTPTSEVTRIPLGFLVGSVQKEDLTNKSIIREGSNVSVDLSKLNQTIGGPSCTDYGKFSQSLDELMNQVNFSLQQNSASGDHNTSICRSDNVGDVSMPENSTSNGSLPCANSMDLLSGSISEKVQDFFSPVNAGEHAEVSERICPEIAIAHGQQSELPFSSHEGLQNYCNEQSCHIYQEPFGSEIDVKILPDSPHQGISAAISVLEDVEQKLETVNVCTTPKNISKSFHFSSPENKFSFLEDKEQQFFHKHSVSSSSKILHISTRNKTGSSVANLKNIKSFQLSSLHGSRSSPHSKQMQLLDFTNLPQNADLHDSAKETSDSMKWDHVEHEEKNYATEGLITSPEMKLKMQSDYCPGPSSKDLVDPVLLHSTIRNTVDPSMKNTVRSDEIIDCTEPINVNITKDLNFFGNSGALKGLDRNDSIMDQDCFRNVGYFSELDRNDTMKNIDIAMQTPENAVKTFQCSSLKGSMASFQSFNKSARDRELHTFLKKEFLKHGERLSSIKLRLTRPSFKSTLSRKDHFITDFLGRLNETNKELDADKQLNALDVQKDMACSRFEMVNNGQNMMSAKTSILTHHGNAGVGLSKFHVGGLNLDRKLDEFSVKPKKTSEMSNIGYCCEQTSGENLSAHAVHFLESMDQMLAGCSTIHSVLKLDQASRKNPQNPLSYVNGSQSSVCQQLTNYVSIVDADKDRGKEQTDHMSCCSEICGMHNNIVTIPEDILGSNLSVGKMHPNEASAIPVMGTQEYWTGVFSKICDMTNQLLPESTSELNIHELDDLESFLDELQTQTKYEELLLTLSNQDCSSDPHQKRILDARYFLKKLGFAKARKQLKCMKLLKLSNEAIFLHSKANNCNKLKSTFSQLLNFKTGDGEEDQTSDRHQEEHNKLMAMKQEHGILEQNIQHLVRYFEDSCKLTGKMSCNDVIKAVDEYLTRKALCQDIQQHLRLWKLSDVVVKNGHYEVIICYCDLLFQSFIVNKNRFSTIVSSNFCDAANIEKKFPNMDACIAFEFVFKLNVDHKLANAKFIHDRTVETNLLMGAVIDVLQEILLSRMELWNLENSTFLLLPSGELQLKLTFYSPNGGRKLILGLDMSSLNCGIYPTNPSEFKIHVYNPEKTFLASTVNETIRAVRSLDRGPLLILRICRCISQVLHSSA